MNLIVLLIVNKVRIILILLSRVYYAPIIGTRGQTKKRLEEETKTIIKVPRQPQDHEVCKYFHTTCFELCDS